MAQLVMTLGQSRCSSARQVWKLIAGGKTAPPTTHGQHGARKACRAAASMVERGGCPRLVALPLLYLSTDTDNHHDRPSLHRMRSSRFLRNFSRSLTKMGRRSGFQCEDAATGSSAILARTSRRSRRDCKDRELKSHPPIASNSSSRSSSAAGGPDLP